MTDTIETVTTEQAEQDNRVIFVPLNKLKKSPKNARKVPHGEVTIEALAASLAHKGLIQNIVIEPEIKDDKPTGRSGHERVCTTAFLGARIPILDRF